MIQIQVKGPETRDMWMTIAEFKANDWEAEKQAYAIADRMKGEVRAIQARPIVTRLTKASQEEYESSSSI